MRVQGAVIREQGQTFAVVVVKPMWCKTAWRPPTRSGASPRSSAYRSC